MNFKDNVVLITGAASGIGKSTALLFASKGAKVVVADINEVLGELVVNEIKSKNGVASFFKCNVAKEEEVRLMVDFVVNTYGRLDIAVNNAGIGGKSAGVTEVETKDFEQVLAVNCLGVFYGMKYQIIEMLKQGSGCIVNTSSIAGLKGLPKSLPYVAAKHAVVGMTKTAALEYAKKGIRINAVCPVFTISNLFQPDNFNLIKPGLANKLKSGIPMKRFGSIDEIGKSILWLCSDYSTFVTGVALPVDGGLTA